MQSSLSIFFISLTVFTFLHYLSFRQTYFIISLPSSKPVKSKLSEQSESIALSRRSNFSGSFALKTTFLSLSFPVGDSRLDFGGGESAEGIRPLLRYSVFFFSLGLFMLILFSWRLTNDLFVVISFVLPFLKDR